MGLESGNYEVTVSSPGFTSFKETAIYVEPAGTYTVNVALKPGAVTTTVTVTGTRAQVQTTTDEISNTVSGTKAQASLICSSCARPAASSCCCCVSLRARTGRHPVLAIRAGAPWKIP